MSTVTRRMGLPTRADLFSPFFFVPYGFFGMFCFTGRSREFFGGEEEINLGPAHVQIFGTQVRMSVGTFWGWAV